MNDTQLNAVKDVIVAFIEVIKAELFMVYKNPKEALDGIGRYTFASIDTVGVDDNKFIEFIDKIKKPLPNFTKKLQNIRDLTKENHNSEVYRTLKLENIGPKLVEGEVSSFTTKLVKDICYCIANIKYNQAHLNVEKELDELLTIVSESKNIDDIKPKFNARLKQSLQPSKGMSIK